MKRETATLTMPDAVRAILANALVDETGLTLVGQLARKDYEAVNKFLVVAGTIWNKKAKRHLFASPEDADRLRSLLATGSVLDERKFYQSFYTPAWLAERMVVLADISDPGLRILEPSAGTGNILKAIGGGPDKVAVEINPNLILVLSRVGVSGLKIYEADFLECNGNLGLFDRVLMNPPFDDGADIKHIRHALTHLKPGGKLVAICANGSRQNAVLKPMSHTWEELPAGTFEGTGVHAVLLSIQK